MSNTQNARRKRGKKYEDPILMNSYKLFEYDVIVFDDVSLDSGYKTSQGRDSIHPDDYTMSSVLVNEMYKFVENNFPEMLKDETFDKRKIVDCYRSIRDGFVGEFANIAEVVVCFCELMNFSEKELYKSLPSYYRREIDVHFKVSKNYTFM